MNLDKFMKDGQFRILALDHRGSFENFIKTNGYLGKPWDESTVFNPVQIKAEIIEAWIDKVSALLVDSGWGLPAYHQVLEKSGKDPKPLLMPVEKSGYQQTSDGRVTEIENRPSQLKSLGAEGVKLLLPMDNSLPSFKTQIETGKTVLKESRDSNLPLFLEIITYGQGLILRIIESCLQEGLVPDVFKLAYPGSPENCQRLTEMINPIPWVLLTGGEKQEVFQSQLKIAIDNGASGFIAGRGLWG